MKLIMISLLVFLSVSADANASKLSISDLLLDSKAPAPNVSLPTESTDPIILMYWIFIRNMKLPAALYQQLQVLMEGK